jgi:5-methyltetrahydropteroyltriglutamate--homocysteine methyltransferase
LIQKELGIDLIPSNDFSLYDHVLDLAFALCAIPDRYKELPRNLDKLKLDLYFAMAKGCLDGVPDITAME